LTLPVQSHISGAAKMPRVRSSLILASHIAFATAFTPISFPRLAVAPNLRSLTALGDLNAPAALNSLTKEHNSMSCRQLGAWGAGIASTLSIRPGRPTADVLAAPNSQDYAFPSSEKIRAGIGTRKATPLMKAGVGKTQWMLFQETFRGKWTGPTTWFGKVWLCLSLFGLTDLERTGSVPPQCVWIRTTNPG
jgi:hypothetical protein